MPDLQLSSGEVNSLSKTSDKRPIVFFDGECVMCNSFVDLLLDLDPEGQIAIASLQGKTAKALLPALPHNRAAWSIFYQDETGVYSQSDAVFRICQRIGGGWSLLAGFRVVPDFIRDGIYRLVARNRYRIMGQYSTCRVPSEKDRDRFLP